MLRLAADEDFNNRIIRGLLRRALELDLIRVQDAGLRSRDDASILEWAAMDGAHLKDLHPFLIVKMITVHD